MRQQKTHQWSPWEQPLTKQQRKIVERRKSQELFGEMERKYNRAVQVLKRNELISARLNEHYPAIAQGETGVTMNDSEVDHLVQVICSGANGWELRKRHNLLVRGLESGVKKLGWSLPVPAPITVESMESSPFTPDSSVLRHRYDRFQEAFYKNFEAQNPPSDNVEENHEFETGQLLFSFLMHSFCLSRFWFDRLPEGILAGIYRYENTVWLELSAGEEESRGVTAGQRRRVFIAPVTQLLLQRWHKRWGDGWPTVGKTLRPMPPDRLLIDFVQQMDPTSGQKSTFTQLASMADGYAAERLPGLVRLYLERPNLGASLSTANWCRLITGLQRQDNPESEKEKHSIRYPQRTPLTDNVNIVDQRRALKELGVLITGGASRSTHAQTRERIRADVDQFLDRSDLSIILQLLAAWTRHLLTEGGAVKRNLALSSVRRYLDWVGEPLVIRCGEIEDPGSFSSEDWEALYEDCLNGSRSNIGGMAPRLADFHQFLEKTYGFAAVDLGDYQSSVSIDASVLTPREYQRARALIACSNSDPHLATISELILILGYRCGLRRSEVWSLELVDFPGLNEPGPQQPELLVRPTKYANTKSWSGTRRLPLSVLLHEDELALLSAYKRKRDGQGVGKSQRRPMFAESGLSGWPAAVNRVFDPITKILQQVSGDPRFRFHHLRHSFVTFTFLRLMEHVPGEHLPESWRCDEEGRDLQPCMDRPMWKAARLPDQGKALWLLSQWAGHGSPSQTLRSYSHLIDWLVHNLIRQRENPTLSLTCQSALLDKSPAAIEQFRHRNGLRDSQTPAARLCDLVIHQWPKDKVRSVEGHWDVPVDTAVAIKPAPKPHENLFCAYEFEFRALEIVRHAWPEEDQPRGIEQSAEFMGIPLDHARRWHRNCKYLMGMRTHRDPTEKIVNGKYGLPERNSRLSTGTPQVRRSLEEKDVDKRLPELPTFVAPPNTNYTWDAAERWYQKLLAWHEEAPEEAIFAMRTTLEHSQRSKGRILVRGLSNQKAYLAMLKKMGLMRFVTIHINVLEGTDESQLYKHWMHYFEVARGSLQLNWEPDVTKRLGRFGRVQILITPPQELNREQNLFWVSFRFTVMSALVVTVDLVGSNWLEQISILQPIETEPPGEGPWKGVKDSADVAYAAWRLRRVD